jgi:hypothetical protein
MPMLRRLNDEGRLAFRTWVLAGAAGEAPRGLLDDPDASSPVEGGPLVEAGPFGTRLAHGRHLTDRLASLPVADLRFNAGVWDWLSLLHIDELLPPATGARITGQVQAAAARYCLQLDNRMWSRHAARTDWEAVHLHGVHARVLLDVPMHIHPDVLEQLSGRQDMFGARGVVAAADALYFDEASGGLKRGRATRTRPGNARRLPVVLKQFQPHLGLAGYGRRQVLDLLPAEFDRWRPEVATASPAVEATVGLAATA